MNEKWLDKDFIYVNLTSNFISKKFKIIHKRLNLEKNKY